VVCGIAGRITSRRRRIQPRDIRALHCGGVQIGAAKRLNFDVFALKPI
jgi:hypothetical protein